MACLRELSWLAELHQTRKSGCYKKIFLSSLQIPYKQDFNNKKGLACLRELSWLAEFRQTRKSDSYEKIISSKNYNLNITANENDCYYSCY